MRDDSAHAAAERAAAAPLAEGADDLLCHHKLAGRSDEAGDDGAARARPGQVGDAAADAAREARTITRQQTGRPVRETLIVGRGQEVPAVTQVSYMRVRTWPCSGTPVKWK